MKKIALAMVVLLALGSFAFGETVVGGEFQLDFTFLDNQVQKFGDGEISIKSDVDEFNKIAMEIDYEHGLASTNDFDLSVDYSKLTTDVSGALGLEGFTLSTTVGFFDTWFTNWNHQTWTEMDYAGGYEFGGNNYYGVQADLGINDAFGLHVYAPTDGSRILAGANYAVAGANGWVWYDMNTVAETSVVGGEVAYSLEDMGVKFYSGFQYGLDSEDYNVTFSASYAMDMLKVVGAFAYASNAGVSYTIPYTVATDAMVAEIDVIATPMEGAELWAIPVFELTDGAADTLESCEVGGSYKLGATKVSLWADVTADDISPTLEFNIFF